MKSILFIACTLTFDPTRGQEKMEPAAKRLCTAASSSATRAIKRIAVEGNIGEYEKPEEVGSPASFSCILVGF